MFNIKQGLKVLRQNVKIAPENPGVYRMLDESGNVLYVGKAKNIKKRIVAYTRIEQLTTRLQRMVAEVRKMEFIIVENENRALILENELIKKLHPKYNILLKDDKTYPHLMLNLKDDFPALRKFRGQRNPHCRYFGPYGSATAVNEVLDTIQKIFMLRSCRDSVFHNRQRPCLLYQIKRCTAPCVGKISQEDYAVLVKEVIAFLEGKTASIQEDLSQKMQQASDAENFELAIALRDRIKALTGIQNHANLEYAALKSVDIVGIALKEEWYCIDIFFIRNGQNCGNAPYFIRRAEEATDAEVLEAFLSTFYGEHLPPKEIFVPLQLENSDFLEKALNAKIKNFSKGNNYKLIETARKNALAAVERRLAENKSIHNNLQEMVEYFDLPRLPQRIEIYDNSHNQGSYAVGAMVVATPDGFDKKSYRTFNIKDTTITNDDFAMMKEVLRRRFDHMNNENRPDVILLDGGLGQLHAVYESLADYDLKDIKIIAISKGVDRNAGKEFYHQLGKESFALPYRSAIAFYLQKLRDEAHRFAIGTHRKKRAKSMVKSSLDEIEGIGAKRKRDLLNHFGSVAAIKDASISDIAKISGISKKTAENIYNYFHK
ncbi:MAG: excinuclease ABC subunit UvrC [Alphaproteobacteria bacterium]|nr:excinuclease ABC subunit UvrC [Alphaproteobacteria bacterium]